MINPEHATGAGARRHAGAGALALPAPPRRLRPVGRRADVR